MKKLEALKSYAMERIQEASTWRGLILIATGCGAAIKPEIQEAVVAGGLMLAGIIAAISADKKQ